MPKKQLNVRISTETRRNLDWLKIHFEESEGEVISRIVDRAFQEAVARYREPDPITEQIRYDAELDAAHAQEDQEYFDNLSQ